MCVICKYISLHWILSFCILSFSFQTKGTQKYELHGCGVLRYKPVVVVQDLLDVRLAHAPDTDTLTWLCGLMAGVFINIY